MNRFLTHVVASTPFAMATERGGSARGAGDQAEDTKRVKRYEVTAFARKDLRDGKRLEDLEKAGRATVFVVEHSDYKTAWEMARTACRLGKLPQGPDPKTNEMTFDEVEPGSLTVKRVMTLDKNVKSNVLSAVEFIRIAQERDITVSQKLLALYEEVVPASQREAIEAELAERAEQEEDGAEQAA